MPFQEPFTSTIVTLSLLLSLVFVTPINQRPFAWEYTQADKFVYDAWDRFVAGLKYNIGSFILFTTGCITYNFDGQSRLIVSLLLLHCAKSYVDQEQAMEIDKYIFLDKPYGIVKLTNEQLEIKQKNNWKKFPRIQSYYPEDFKALGDCLNNKEYEHKFIKECWEACKKFLDSVPKDKISEFIDFILNETTALKKNYTLPTLAAKDMDIENNRGRHMSPFDNARNNLITSKTSEQNTISKTLDTLRGIFKGLETACIAYTGSIVDGRKKDFINETITKMTRKEETDTFMEIVRKVIEKWEDVKNTNVYKFLDCCYKEYIWNIWIPVAVLNDMNATDSLRLARRCLYHLVQHGVFSVNSLGILNHWIISANTWVTTKTYDLPTLKQLTTEELYTLIHATEKFPRFVAKVYSEMLQSDAAPIDMDECDVEHIIPQSTKAKYIHKLGNLTWFERKKPKDIPGLCGNRSIKNRDYSEKKLAYKLSSIVATRNIADTYETFDQTSIDNRGKDIVSQILSMEF